MELMNLLKEKDKEEERRSGKARFLIRYIVSGVASVVAQFAVLSSLVEFLSVEPTLSSGAAYVMGCLVNYLMLYFWTFNSKGNHVILIFKYFLVTTSTLLLNLLLFWAMTELLHVWYLISQSVATVLVAVGNMILNQQFTFAEPSLAPLAEEKAVEPKNVIGALDYEE